MRYKANCDINWELLQLSIFLDREENEIDEKAKESFEKYLKDYEIYDIIKEKKGEMTFDDLFNLIKDKKKLSFETELSDCHLYKSKQIGDTFGDFWNFVCKRHQWADATKEDWDDFHGDYDPVEDEYYDQPNYQTYEDDWY
jgi:hypothetical protein